MVKRILITPGEPAGIGPELTLKIAQLAWPVELIVIADPDLLTTRAQQVGLPFQYHLYNEHLARPHVPGTLSVLPIKLQTASSPGILNPKNAPYVLHTLEQAVHLCMQQKADALVTGPVHKQILNEAGFAFTGHTEFFAELCQIPLTVMMFVVDELKVALATTHIPLSRVAENITQEKLASILSILHTSLKNDFHLPHPRIAVCGLNPHAGEGGHLGQEEITIITPLLNTLRQQGYTLIGPIPADTAFTPMQLAQTDAVLAMYHDQALPVIKHLGFDRAVNCTLGLPFIRTSVDHGTALSLAGTGQADTGSMEAAIKLACTLALPH